MSISDRTSVDLSGYEPVAPSTPAPAAPPASTEQPGKNPFLRCSLPTLWKSDPDALRQFPNPTVPQARIFTPLPATLTGNVSETNYVSGGSSGSGGGNSTTDVNISGDGGTSTFVNALYATNAVLQTGALGPNQRFVGSVLMSNSFQLLSVATSSACRIQIYGSLAAQQADAARGLDDPLPAGVFQSLIADLALDTIPLQWVFQNSVGANTEEPQSNQIYVTVTNLGVQSGPITVNVQYVPLAVGVGPQSTITLGNTPPITQTTLASLANFALLSGANFTGAIQANLAIVTNVQATTIDTVDINATGSLVVDTFSATTIDAVNLNATGSVVATLFEGDVSAVNITATGTTISNDFSGTGTINISEVVTNTVNGVLPSIENFADVTLNHVVTQTAVSGATFTFTLAELTSTGVSFTVTANGTGDVCNVSAEMLYKVTSGTNGAFLVALVDGVIGSQFGFGIDNIPSTSGPSVCVFTGSTTGLSAGSHTITLYFASMVLISGSPAIQAAGGVTNLRCQAQLQQISE